MSEITTLPASTLMTFIERAARDDTFNVEKFSALLSLQRDAEHDHARKMFNRAMAEAQSEMMPVIRSAQNKHLGNKYAKLEDIDREMRPIYTKHGFSVRFGSAPAPREGDIRITCTVAHEAGYYEENYLDAPASMVGSQGGRMAVTPVQAVGSVVSYLRRYLETMVFNVVLADDDDDGEGTRRAAAAPPKPHPMMPNGPVDPSPVDASKPGRTGAQWNVWVDKLEAAIAVLYRRSELDDLVWKPAFKAAKAEAPENVRRDIDKILAAAYERLPAEPIENDPTIGGEEELPEVEIVGGEKIAAG